MDKNEKQYRDAIGAYMKDVQEDPEYKPPLPGETRAAIQDQALREYADDLCAPKRRTPPKWLAVAAAVIVTVTIISFSVPMVRAFWNELIVGVANYIIFSEISAISLGIDEALLQVVSEDDHAYMVNYLLGNAAITLVLEVETVTEIAFSDSPGESYTFQSDKAVTHDPISCYRDGDSRVAVIPMGRSRITVMMNNGTDELFAQVLESIRLE